MFPAPAAGPTHYSLDGPAAALTVLLAADAVASLIGTVLAGGTIAAVLLYLPLVPVFLVWFYRARKNADGRGQLQRHSPGWAIGAWFVPFVNLVFPFQIMTGIWRANEPEDRRSRALVLVGFWWGCWLGGGILREVGSRLGSTSAGPARGVNILADVLTAAAAILLFVIVRAITRGPVGREPVTAGPGLASPGSLGPGPAAQDWPGPGAAPPATPGLGPTVPAMPWPGAPYPQPVPAGQGGRRKGVGAGYSLSALAVVAVTAITAAILWPVPKTTPAPTPTAQHMPSAPAAPRGRQLTAEQLRTGDCLIGQLGLGTNNPWPETVTSVPCTRKHLAEIFFSANSWPAAEAFPGNATLNHQAVTKCNKAFRAYDGVGISASSYSYDFISPQGRQDWVSGDRLLTCVAYLSTNSHPGGEALYASIKGSFM
jgi:Domain of unknown function (DUF4328)/Septum formation